MKKRQLPRKPLTADEESAGVSYFGGSEIDDIIATLPDNANLDREAFQQALETAADLYVCLAHGVAEFDVAPSVEARHWQPIHAALDNAIMSFNDSPPWAIQTLQNNAELKADAENFLPDFEAENLPPGALPSIFYSDGRLTIWPVEEQIRKSIDNLKWLRDVVAQAEAAANADKATTGGNREDVARRLIYRRLRIILSGHFPDKSFSAWTERETDDVKGPLADFLEAVFRPLGINASRATLVKAFRRANGT